jgi:DNA replication and repair protein RecF
MKLERLRLRNFRNWRDLDLVPGPGINFIFGTNGQGKTSVLESLGVLSGLKSFKTNNADELITHNERLAEIDAVLSATGLIGSSDENFDWRTDLKVSLSLEAGAPRAKKTAFINGKPFKSALSFVSQRFGNAKLGFHAVIFNPSDHDLVRGDPSYRRQALDRILAAEGLDHLKDLQAYQKLLEQRNALLKSDQPVETMLLDGFSDALVTTGAKITLRRLEWLKNTAPLVRDVLRSIAPSQIPVDLHYSSKWAFCDPKKITNINNLNHFHFAGQQDLPSLEDLRKAFAETLRHSRPVELRTQTTLVGPHRDDWGFDLGEQFLQTRGSQGEVRSVLLAFKLSEVRSFKEKNGLAPVFLLDDFSSELDDNRRTFLLEFLRSSDLQVFITTTDRRLAAGKCFEVESGVLTALKPNS